MIRDRKPISDDYEYDRREYERREYDRIRNDCVECKLRAELKDIKSQPIPNKWLSPGFIGPIFTLIISGAYGYTWTLNNRMTAVEYKIETITERHTMHEREDIEFKQTLKELNGKLEHLKEQIASLETTVMNMYSSHTNKRN